MNISEHQIKLLCSIRNQGLYWVLMSSWIFPGGACGKQPACQRRRYKRHSIPGSGRFPGGRNGNWLQYSRLENSMDRRAWQATVRELQRIRHYWSHLARMHTQPNLLSSGTLRLLLVYVSSYYRDQWEDQGWKYQGRSPDGGRGKPHGGMCPDAEYFFIPAVD